MVRQGEAPLSIEKLPVGDYVAVARRGDYEESRPVKIQRQQRAEAKIDLNLGSVEASADPADAELDLSGGGRHWQSKVPMRVDDVPAGNYSLLARRKGWELSADVSVSRGNVTTNRIEFPYGSIAVTSEPSGLVVSNNGVEVGKTPIVLRELRPGPYVVTATDGENALTATVSVGPKEEVKKPFMFHYGAVKLASTPAGATVVRNRKEIGKTPLMLDRIPAGEISVELRLQGYAPTNVTLRIVDGGTADLTAKLISERYLEAVRKAREALDGGRFSDSLKYIATALEAEPDDTAAIKLRAAVAQAEQRAKEAVQEAERKKTLAIIEKAITAHGGRDALMRFRASKSVSTTTSKLKDGTPCSIRTTSFTQLPDKSRIDQEIRYRPKSLLNSLTSLGFKIEVNGKTPSEERIVHGAHCVTGNQAWMLAESISKPMPLQLAQNLRNGLYIGECTQLVPLLGDDFQRERLTSWATAPQNCLAIRIRKNGKPDFILYFDGRNGLIVGLEYQEKEEGGKSVRVNVRYGEYRNFSGQLQPTHIQFYRDDKLSSASNVESIVFFESLSDDMFRSPVGAK